MEDSPLWTLGNLRFDPDTTDANGVLWFLAEEEGFFGAPSTNAETTQRLGAHGAYRSPGYKTERTISLKGNAFAGSYRALRTAVNQITGVLSDPFEPAALTCYAETGPLTCDVYLDGDILTTPLGTNSPGIEWSLQVLAPDPRKYSTVAQSMRAEVPRADTGDGLEFMATPDTTTFSTFSTPAAGGHSGLDFTTHGGLLFGESNATGIMQLVNAGTAPTNPVYTLYGPLTDPTLTATTGGLRSELTYNARLGPGEFVVIDPAAPSVLLAGTASRRHLLNPAQFAGFAVPGTSRDGGTLSVGLTHQGASTDGGYVVATYRNAWF